MKSRNKRVMVVVRVAVADLEAVLQQAEAQVSMERDAGEETESITRALDRVWDALNDAAPSVEVVR